MSCPTGLKERPTKSSAWKLIQWLEDEGKILPGEMEPVFCMRCGTFHVRKTR
ncbi:hypothetical protein [Actinomadura violacea]|uniref:Uncharacterized protein n=1 Tax=Actinomadura violacea TaxID=2819934 RepID=A0ABS3RW52_9ACTN|nr:hypothetical protein [Actinomadura violacea]MBO2460991.1 hypothetical protein [Actinomadura violacea]